MRDGALRRSGGYAESGPFDPSLAAGPTRVLSLQHVVDLLRVTHAPDRVAEYRAAMIRGQRFPPIAVVRLGGRFVVADGHKRLSAYASAGRHDIVVEVWTLRRLLRDQARQVMGNARKNGAILRRSVTDPRGAWRLLLTTLRHWRRVALSLACVAGLASEGSERDRT